jgi:hypothetical protein
MNKLNAKIKIGTKVILAGDTEKTWRKIIEINGPTFKVENNYGGSWQAGHIVKFSNKF